MSLPPLSKIISEIFESLIQLSSCLLAFSPCRRLSYRATGNPFNTTYNLYSVQKSGTRCHVNMSQKRRKNLHMLSLCDSTLLCTTHIHILRLEKQRKIVNFNILLSQTKDSTYILILDNFFYCIPEKLIFEHVLMELGISREVDLWTCFYDQIDPCVYTNLIYSKICQNICILLCYDKTTKGLGSNV